MNGDKHYNLTVSDDNGKSLTTTNVSTKHPDEIVRLMTLAGLAQAQQAPAPMPEPDCGCDGGGEVEVVGTVDESEYEPTGPQDMDLNDYSKKTAVSISRQGKRIQPSHGDNPLGYSLDEDDIFESLILEYKKFEEAADNPFAVGMAMAKKSTKDTPPLKKSTVNKAHDIAKAIQKNESVQKKSEKIDEAQLDEAPLLGPKGAIHRAAGAEQSDREYIEQRQFKDKWKKENPGKTWPGYDKAGFKSRYYKTESAQKKTKVKEDTQNFDLNELKIEYPKKKDTLGIPRDEMPQVKSAHYDELIDFFKQYGIHIEKQPSPQKHYVQHKRISTLKK